MKRIISMILMVLMLVTAVPVSVMAADAPIIPETGMPFTDVKATHWFYDAVKYTYEAGIFSANNAAGDKFAPNATLTRGMFVTLLFRLSGESENEAYTGETIFTDVPVNQWYAKAVQWANEKGYVAGMSETTFAPNGKITRAQMARILSLYASDKDGYDLEDVRPTAFEKFGDKSKAPSWAVEGITWMSTTGLINGMGTENGAPMLKPNANATRAQAAQILMSYMELRYNATVPVGDIMIGDTSIKEYSIVYGTTAAKRGESAKVCAEQLQSYLAQALGVSLPVYKDTDKEVSQNEILIGKTNREGSVVNVDRTVLPDGDAFLMEVQNGYLILASDENYSATQYAVYEFLETFAGVTFFGVIETMTQKNCFTVPADFYHVETTTMHHRDFIFDKGGKPHVGHKLREGAGLWSQANFYHSIPALGKDPSEFRPDWSYYAQYHMDRDPCLTDPQIQQNIITNVKTQLKQSPHSNFIWVAMSDGTYYCKNRTCGCGDFYRAHGVTSTYFNILDVVGEAIAEEHPNVSVVGLAYKYTWKLPENFNREDISDNVIVCVCTDNVCTSHIHTDMICEDVTHGTKKFSDIFDAWCEYAPTLWVWDYTSGSTFTDAPFPIIHQLYYNYQDFHNRGVTGMIVLGEGDVDSASFTALKSYLVSKLVWDKDMTEAEYWDYVDSFLEAYYGDGWTYIREYIDFTFELTYENEWHIWSKERWDTIIRYDQYLEHYDYLRGLWTTAEELAATEEQKHRVRCGAVQMEYVKVCMAWEKYDLSESEADFEAFKVVNQGYADYIAELGNDNYKLPSNWTVEVDPNTWRNDAK